MKLYTFGNTFLGFIVAIILINIFFYGDPDVVDAIRSLALKYAGLAE